MRLPCGDAAQARKKTYCREGHEDHIEYNLAQPRIVGRRIVARRIVELYLNAAFD